MLLFGRDVVYIQEKVSAFGYHIKDEEIGEIFAWLKEFLPEKYISILDSRGRFDLNDEKTVEWLKELKVLKFYNYCLGQNDNLKDPPAYFKWFKDCEWAHTYKDVMCLINILIFNNEPYEDISNIIEFKFKKKIGNDALKLYQEIYWDIETTTAKEALYYCEPFRKNALIIRNMRGGTEFEQISESEVADESSDGSDVPLVFHDVMYIKWKIGYRDISVPSSREFLERVKTDSMFRYYEAQNMIRSHEVEEEEGTNDKLGDFNGRKVKKRNVDEQKANMSKKYLDIFIKADGALPPEGKNSDEFFDRMRQMELNFTTDETEESIARIDEVEGMLDDIKGDMSSNV